MRDIGTSENRSTVESQNLIIDAFLELMNEKKYADINIKEICLRAGVSRQTFYTHFQTKENVIASLMKYTCVHPEEAFIKNGKMSIELMSNIFADFIYNNFDLLKLLIDHDLVQEINRFLYLNFSGCSSWNDLVDMPKEALMCFFTSGMTGLISYVVIDQKHCNKAYLQDTIAKLFSGGYLI